MCRPWILHYTWVHFLVWQLHYFWLIVCGINSKILKLVWIDFYLVIFYNVEFDEMLILKITFTFANNLHLLITYPLYLSKFV